MPDNLLSPTPFIQFIITPITYSHTSIFTVTPTNPTTPLHAQASAFAGTTPFPKNLLINIFCSTPSLSLVSPSALRAAAEHFSLTFFPWLDPSLDDSEREADLAETLSSALQCRMWLLGLEGAWGVEWQESGNGVVVVRPAVVVSGEGGRKREVLGQSVLAI